MAIATSSASRFSWGNKSTSPTQAVQDASGELWADIQKIADPVTDYATVELDEDDTSAFAIATGFNFLTGNGAIPPDRTILGIKVELVVSGDAGTNIINDFTLLTKTANWATITCNKAVGDSVAAAVLTPKTLPFGDTDDLWGTYWNLSDIRSNPNFGVMFSFENYEGDSNEKGNCHQVIVSVTYSD